MEWLSPIILIAWVGCIIFWVWLIIEERKRLDKAKKLWEEANAALKEAGVKIQGMNEIMDIMGGRIGEWIDSVKAKWKIHEGGPLSQYTKLSLGMAVALGAYLDVKMKHCIFVIGLEGIVGCATGGSDTAPTVDEAMKMLKAAELQVSGKAVDLGL